MHAHTHSLAWLTWTLIGPVCLRRARTRTHAVLESELQQPLTGPGGFFSRLSATPVAAASLGQVGAAEACVRACQHLHACLLEGFGSPSMARMSWHERAGRSAAQQRVL